jgi:hypothetical protein
MKIKYLTHACLLIEINGFKILTDPWLTGPCWGGSLWHYPTHSFSPKNLPKPDIIFYSHGHDDHFHEETISNFPKSWRNSLILAPNFNKKWWEKMIKNKFSNIKFLNHNENFIYKNKVKFQIFVNDQGEMDSSLKISFLNKCIFLQTDNLMSLNEAKRISKIEKIDFAFVLPFLTGVYPGFYKWDSDTLISLGKQKIKNSLNYCSEIVRNLKPKYTIPYACDLGYLGEKFHINLIHTHNKNDLAKVLKKKKIKTEPIILNPGDYIKYNKNLSVNILNKDQNQFDSLIRFANDKSEEYANYIKKQNNLKNTKFNMVVNLFKKNLLRNFSKLKKFNFKTLINISENHKTKSLLLDFKKKEIFLVSKHDKVDLKINIDSSKIRSLLLKKYPMNFMTFHNGGYTCERVNMRLSENEKRYWGWINRLDFFI